MQFWHAVEPGFALILPASQAVHEAALPVENLPASHKRQAWELDPDQEPAGQTEQFTDPSELNSPPSQAVHVVAAVATPV